MKPSDRLALSEPAKQTFATALAARLTALPAVRSVTFTGSFVEKPGLAGISDIDVIVVVEALTAEVFSACRSATAAVSPALLGLPAHELRINDTFGPLKFDQPGTVVVHLMVYDLAGHREHVLKSPFTCLDWERSPHHLGPSLRALYPVLGLFPRHFLEARRSLTNYLDDLAAGTLSYRRHDFSGAARAERTESLPLDSRHQGEYAYHIVANLVANYAKLILGQNVRLAATDLLAFWQTHLPACAPFIAWFQQLAAIKHARQEIFPADTLPRTRDFITAFADHLHTTWHHRATRHTFVRHARTALNDGSFLGQRRDPGILEAPPPLPAAPDRVIASPATRCHLTATALAPDSTIEIDPRLLEIDYGAAEGLTFSELRSRYPDLISAWAAGEDPRFPDGENTRDVLTRLQLVIAGLDHRPTLVVTHNVVLRCLLGSVLNLPLAQWHHIPVAHLESISVLRLDGHSYLDLTPEQVARIADALAAPHP